MENSAENIQKRPYEAPSMEVIELAETPLLLAASTPNSRKDYDPTSW